MSNKTQNTDATWRILTDQALGEGRQEFGHDGLSFKEYAEVLADVALSDSPLTIGVFGEWGTGKTSLMRMIEKELKGRGDKNIVTVWFNAWRYEQETHPIVPLVASIIKELESKKNVADKAGETRRSLVRALRAVAYGFSANAKVKVPGLAEVEAGFVAKDMIDREAALSHDPLLDRSLNYAAFERLEEIVKDVGGESESSMPKIVVLVDDLDRCFPDSAIRLLESIKLVLAQPGFVFILGVARKVIEGYLEHRYDTEYGIKDFKSASYLDKIVQVPFPIPSHTGRIEDFSKKVLERVGEKYRQDLESVLPIIAIASESNPRTVVRFVNNLQIDKRIAATITSQDSKKIKEIPLEFFAVTRCLQFRWSDIFAKLAVAPDDFCLEVADYSKEKEARKKKSSDEADDGAPQAGKREIPSPAVLTLLKNHENLQRFLASEPGQNWLRDGELRRAAVSFLRTQRQEPETERERAVRQRREGQQRAESEALARVKELHQELPKYTNRLVPCNFYIFG